MSKTLVNLQALVLILLSLIGWVERPGEGAQKKEEVLEHMNEALKADNITLPAFISGAIGAFLPALINMIISWIDSKPAVKSLIDHANAILATLSMAILIVGNPADQASKDALIADVKRELGNLGLTIPSWVWSAYDIAAPMLIGLIVSWIAGGKASFLSDSTKTSENSPAT